MGHDPYDGTMRAPSCCLNDASSFSYAGAEYANPHAARRRAGANSLIGPEALLITCIAMTCRAAAAATAANRGGVK